MDAVYRFARRRVGPDDAEDVTQQSFAALFEAEAAGRAPDTPGAYLLGTARRRIADLFRRRGRPAAPVPLPEGWQEFATAPLPDEALEAEELRELVHVALGLLSFDARRLLLRFHEEGIRTPALAAEAGVTAKAIEMRLRRARQSFSRHFADVAEAWCEPLGGVGGGS